MNKDSLENEIKEHKSALAKKGAGDEEEVRKMKEELANKEKGWEEQDVE